MATQPIDKSLDFSAAEAFSRIVERIPPIPARQRPHGPLTARRLNRFYAFLAIEFLLGITPLILGMSAPWQAFGLGMIFPGAGFLYAGGIGGVIFAALSLAIFAVVMFLWWARGPILAPPAVIVVAAALSALWIGEGGGVIVLGYAIPVAVAGLHIYLAFKRRARFAEQQARGAQINTLLAKAVIAFYLTFFPVTVNTLLGLQSVDRAQVALLRSFGADGRSLMLRLQLPTALPQIFVALRLGASLSLVGAIVGEWFGDTTGLGVLLLQAMYAENVVGLWAAILCAAVLGTGFYAVVAETERRLVFWRAEQ